MTVSQVVESKARELAVGASSPREMSARIAAFVKDGILYYLDEWNVAAEQVLEQQRGMCAGKALLAAALHRAAGIPIRFKVLQISGEEGPFSFIARRLEEETEPGLAPQERRGLLHSARSLSPERDHIILQAFLDDRWTDLDPARDRDLDNGMRLVGIWRERKVLSETGPMDSIDGWLKQRMRRRTVIEGRKTFLQFINRQMEEIRRMGRLMRQAGIQPWTGTEVREATDVWALAPGYPIALATSPLIVLRDLAGESRPILSETPLRRKAALERKLIRWLHALVRQNIKRGRFWELSQVLTQRRADCLGYSRLLSFLAADFGLTAGVVEVVQDNAGRYVPHYACMVEPAGGRRQLVDLWYGSSDIRHRILLARVKEGGRLVPREVPLATFRSSPDLRGLSQDQLAAISLYIMGNSHLARDLPREAIDCYDASLWLFPANNRTLFNRAIALEQMGETAQARQAYERALSSGLSAARLLATVEELEPMIELDERGVSGPGQQVYLLRRGLITGRREGWSAIARRCRTTPAEAARSYEEVIWCLKATPTAHSQPGS